MKRLVGLLLLLPLTACMPWQVEKYFAAKALGGEAAAAADAAVLEYLAIKEQATAGRPCPQWYDIAMDSGWQPHHWPTVALTMRGESGCNPGAYNRSGASGLMQVMPMWADDCGGTRTDLFDPAFNLTCAKHILDVSSWRAWEAWSPSYGSPR